MICPCKDCTDRHRACHDHCEKFKAWKDDEHKKKQYLKDKIENHHELNFLRYMDKKGKKRR
jgi:hypothetical protein